MFIPGMAVRGVAALGWPTALCMMHVLTAQSAFACNSGNVDQGNLLSSAACQASSLGGNSVAIGAGANASKTQGVAVGSSAQAVDFYAVAIGGDSKASGNSSIAVGSSAKAEGQDAFAAGVSAKAVGINEITIGSQSGYAVGADYSINIGSHAGTFGAGLYSIGIGSGDNTGHNFSVRASGDFSIALGGGNGDTFTPAGGQQIYLTGALATGYLSNAIGTSAFAGGGGSTAVGAASSANGDDSIAVGDFSKAAGSSAIAIGLFSQGTSTNSVALGGNAFAGGNNSAALGSSASASGGSSAAFGPVSRASGANSAAMGYASNASGSHSLALGGLTKAGGASKSADTTAVGYGAQATFASSVALGTNSVADAASTVSVGSVGHERRVTNVAKATKGTDAVNLTQVKALIAASKSRSPEVADLSTVDAAPGLLVVAASPSRHGSTSGPTGSAGTSAHDDANNEQNEPIKIVGWANVRQTGELSASRNAAGNKRLEVGRYEIAFKGAAPSQCTYQVTFSGAGYASVTTTVQSKSLMIETRNQHGVLVDRAFHVMAVC